MEISTILALTPAALIFIGGIALMICISRPTFRDELRIGRMDFGNPTGFVWLDKGQTSYREWKRIEDEADGLRRAKEWEAQRIRQEQEWKAFEQRMADLHRALAGGFPRLHYFDPSQDTLEIKRRYRRLARELHPDLNDSPQAAEKFRAMQAEYESLNLA